MPIGPGPYGRRYQGSVLDANGCPVGDWIDWKFGDESGAVRLTPLSARAAADFAELDRAKAEQAKQETEQ